MKTISNGDVNMYTSVLNCSNLNLSSNNGHLIISSGGGSNTNLASVTTSVWFKTTETYSSWHNGKQRVIRSNGNFNMFPYFVGSGEDELGQFQYL